MKTKLLFKIIFIFLFGFFVNCSNRDDDTNNDFANYSVEISYKGDIQNWKEDLNISTHVDSGVIPSVNGINTIKIEKNNDENYTFYFPIDYLKSKKIDTSKGIKEIKITGLLSPINGAAEEVTVFVKVYKNNLIKGEFSFPFNYNSSFKYYIINVN